MLFNNKLFNSIACLLSFTNLQLVIPGRTWILLYLGRTMYKRLWACLALYGGPTKIQTRIAGFKVQSANHYTIGPQICEHLRDIVNIKKVTKKSNICDNICDIECSSVKFDI